MRPNLRSARQPYPPLALADKSDVLPKESTYLASCVATVQMRFKGSSARKSPTNPTSS
jgi:hypothetical protein